MDFLSLLSLFVLSCFVGFYVVWSVTPALHSPLMAVTNAISSVIIVGAFIVIADQSNIVSYYVGLLAIFLTSINIFGGFLVTRRMLAMFVVKNKKGKKNDL
jgi:NAD(P) transhydrogenase subunit alpha